MSNLLILEETDSTNTYLKNLIDRSEIYPEPGTAVWAKRQTGGRGRLGRTFVSPEGGIYLSIALPPVNTMTITAKAAVAVLRTLRNLCSVEAGIKWVNDIYLNGKKVCGILAEYYKDTVILGIGLNYATRITDLGSELSKTATVIYDNPAFLPCKTENIVNSLIKETVSLCLSDSLSFLDEYRKADILYGKSIRILQAGKETSCGIANGIDDSCGLIVRTNDEIITINSGEVTVRLE